MQNTNDRPPSGLREVAAGVVEVKIWEAFLVHNRYNLQNTLSAYAIENGPANEIENESPTVSFRFTEWDWNNTLRGLLSKHNVPIISESHLKSSVYAGRM